MKMLTLAQKERNRPALNNPLTLATSAADEGQIVRAIALPNASVKSAVSDAVWRGFLATATTFLLAAAPALAEAPSVGTEAVRQNNINRLMLLNACEGCDLQGVTLSESHLIGADLRDANLQGANLTDSNLEGADLEGADLTGANLTGAFLTNASLVNARLDSVNFSGAHLYYVDVAGASIENLNLTGAQLLNTPIYVGGEEVPLEDNAPPESIIPFEETKPPTKILPLPELEPGTY